MAKSPGDRFPGAIELAEAIDEVASALSGDTGELTIRRSGAVRRIATAPTMLDVSDTADLVAPPSRAKAKPRGSFLGSLMFLVILLGGAGAAVWWIKLRDAGTKAVAEPTASSDTKPDSKTQGGPQVDTAPGGNIGSSVRAGSGSVGTSDVGSSAAGTGSRTAPAGSGSAAVASGTGSGEASTPGLGSSEPPPGASGAERASESGAEPSSGSGGHADVATGSGSAGSASDTVEMNPATADNPAPAKATPDDDDEAANAPKTTEEAEKHAPPTPAIATTLPAAIQLIKEGKREQAIASLTALWKKTPNSSSIPFLLGNLYFDQHWWSVALEHYTAAIKKNADYRANPTLNHNVIRMLASPKTSRMAQGFLKYTVGKFALPYLKYAAQHDANPQVKRLSGWLAKNI